jgi:flagellar biosynthesis GTPase FlhF
MSVDPKQQQQQQPVPERIKVIGFKVTERELQNTIYPIMHDCYYRLGILSIMIYPVTSFLRFCIQSWIGHYRMKKQQQFDLSHQEIEQEEKKKLAAIVAQKEAWHRWDNSTPRVIEKATKEIEEMGKDLDREFKQQSQQPPQQQQQQLPQLPKPKPQQQASPLGNLSLEDMMA